MSNTVVDDVFTALDVDDVDPQLVSASLCYLLTRYSVRPSAGLHRSVLQHLQLLAKMGDAMSPEAYMGYCKLLQQWQQQTEKKLSRGESVNRCAPTIH